MAEMRFNHMELTFPEGTLTKEFREEVDGFYGSVFGWMGVDTEVVVLLDLHPVVLLLVPLGLVELGVDLGPGREQQPQVVVPG